MVGFTHARSPNLSITVSDAFDRIGPDIVRHDGDSVLSEGITMHLSIQLGDWRSVLSSLTSLTERERLVQDTLGS